MNFKNKNIENSTERKGAKLLPLFLVIFLLISSFFLGVRQGEKSQLSENNVSLVDSFVINQLEENSTFDFSLFWKVWNLLKEKHIDRENFKAEDLMYGAIKGMLQATGDPYTNFFDPEETASFKEEINGTFEGIGAELGIKDEILTIIAPLPDSPAEKAGIKASDKIVKIDDQMASDYTIDEAVKMIRGKEGTQVKLSIYREGEEQTRDITITRDVIHLKSLTSEFREDGIAYVKLNSFSEETTDEFQDFASEVVKNKSKGIIIDLRNNPGGLVDKCIEVASFLLEKNQVVVIEEDSQGNKTSFRSIGGDRLSYLPAVVLIDEGSASASEILAGALRDDRQIKIVGKNSFGKGTVQEYISLSGGTSTKITIARWLTPNGTYIEKNGIKPDYEIDFSDEDIQNNNDSQLNKAIEILNEEIEK